MRAKQYTSTAVLSLTFCLLSLSCFSQLGISFQIKKPKEHEDELLPYEKNADKKFTLFRRITNNATTHYNYFFNANNKLNEALERAKLAHKDDYSQLLSFYNYSLDRTAADSIQLDSITYKASIAIALHDLRSDWADNMYLLWGASYYLQKKFDSAYLMFQFINYAFAPKEKDGYYVTIGSPRDGNTANSISTKEKTSLPRKIFSEPPSRNDAFIWQIRNFLAQDQFAEAASLIVTLRTDPLFPKRLKNDLEEVQAFWFYKQNMWDSSATHLVNALDNAVNQQEKARWEFLLAQLYELTGNYKESEKYYARVSKHTTDPIMDIYARLFTIRVNRDGEKSIEKNVAALMRMAKQDKYEDYKDIIYYTAAQMQLQGNDPDAAMSLLLKSTQFTVNNPEQRNRAFLQLAELSFARRQYREAANYYDSLRLDDPSIKNPEELIARKNALRGLATSLETIEREDSLQRIAAMPEDIRKDFVRNLVKTLRKEKGMKDEAPGNTNSPFPTNPTLFPTSQPKGEWYFYNAASRARGQADFKNKWGTRPNVDNWRRSAILTAIGYISGQNPMQIGKNTQTNPGTGSNTELSFDALYNNLPLSPEQMKRSNDSLQAALFTLGKIYVQQIEDCNGGIQTFERIRNNFPDFKPMDEVLFNLYYCYTKSGETSKAAAIKKLMSDNYSASPFTSIVTTGKDPRKNTTSDEATKVYENIYDLFIEGNFEQAVAEKKAADSKYGSYYWTPQLLYIESVYYIKQRNDSAAIRVLNSLLSQFANSPMALKAATMIDVLNRRAQIEKELKDLVVTRNIDSVVNRPVNTPTNSVVYVRPDSVRTQPNVVTNPPPARDTATVRPMAVQYKFSASDAHYVVVVLSKVDKVYVNETKTAFERFNRETYYNKTFTAGLADFDADTKLLFISPFKNAAEAVTYIDQTRPKAATQIVPWLKNGKYSFIILSDANNELLKTGKNIDDYKAFLNQQFPGKF